MMRRCCEEVVCELGEVEVAGEDADWTIKAISDFELLVLMSLCKHNDVNNIDIHGELL